MIADVELSSGNRRSTAVGVGAGEGHRANRRVGGSRRSTENINAAILNHRGDQQVIEGPSAAGMVANDEVLDATVEVQGADGDVAARAVVVVRGDDSVGQRQFAAAATDRRLGSTAVASQHQSSEGLIEPIHVKNCDTLTVNRKLRGARQTIVGAKKQRCTSVSKADADNRAGKAADELQCA